MKTKEELKELKEEYEILNNKLKELTEDELKQVTGGTEGSEYKYVILAGSFVWRDDNHYETLKVIEDVRTNDSSYTVHCISLKRNAPTPVLEPVDNHKDIPLSIFIDYYKRIGGTIIGMTIQ